MLDVCESYHTEIKSVKFYSQDFATKKLYFDLATVFKKPYGMYLLPFQLMHHVDVPDDVDEQYDEQKVQDENVQQVEENHVLDISL